MRSHARRTREGAWHGQSQDVLARAEGDGAAPGTEYRFAAPPATHAARTATHRRSGSAPRRLCVAAAAVLAAIGLWHAGHATYLNAKAALGQHLLMRAWTSAQATGGAVKPWPWADTHPVARLLVPAHDIELLVLAGANGPTLAWGPGHLHGSAVPGTRGNSIVSAHRDTHFAFLRTLRTGERIVVETASGSRTNYRVERQFIADHRRLRLPAGDMESTLSLVTCFPFDAIDPATPLRYAVVARAEKG